MTANVQRMIVTNAGDIGVGTSAPLARLHVVGLSQPLVFTGYGANAPDAMQIIGGSGGTTDANFFDGGKGGGVLIQGGSGGSHGLFGSNGAGGSISLQPGTPFGNVIMAGANGTGVGIGDPTGYNSIFKLNVNGDVLLGLPGSVSLPQPRLLVVTPNAHGLRVQTDTAGGRLASFGGLGRFEIDAPGVVGGRLEVTEAGDVGIGTPAPSYKLEVNGSVAGVGPYKDISDARFKTDIAPLTNALQRLIQLRGVTFTWRSAEFPEMNFDQGRQAGLIAQELQRVLPEAVRKDAKGYYRVAYSEVVPLLVEALKEEHAQNESLRTRLDALEQLMRKPAGER
jgi:hypothetical protein